VTSAPAPTRGGRPQRGTSRWWAALLAASVVLLGSLGLGFQATLARRLPSPADWTAAAALLEREALPGDAVALAPWWAERAREIVPARLPVLAFPRLAGEDLVGVRRVWLLALPGAPGGTGSAARDLAERAAPASRPSRLGALELSRHDLRAPLLPLAFLPDRLASAGVRVGDLACAANARLAFTCPSAPRARVAREVREIDYLPRTCVYARPSPGLPLAVTFRSVPLGRTLRGHTGIVGEAALEGHAHARLSVSVEAEELGSVEEPGEPGWHAFAMDTTRHAGAARDVTFTVAAGDVAERHLCFDAYTLP